MGIRPNVVIWVTESLQMLPTEWRRMIWIKFQRGHAKSFSADFNTVGMIVLCHFICLLLNSCWCQSIQEETPDRFLFFPCDNTHVLDCSTTDEIQGLGSGSVNSWAIDTSYHQTLLLLREVLWCKAAAISRNCMLVVLFLFVSWLLTLSFRWYKSEVTNLLK